MSKDVISAKLDIIFKKLFTGNLSLLSSFLESILDMPEGSIKNIEIADPNILPSDVEGKQGQLDLKMNVDDKIVNVEMQMQNKGDFKDRSLYYWAKMYSDELKVGEEYNKLKQTIAINLLNFNMFDCQEAYSTFRLLETDRHELMTDKCAILFFELKKVNKLIDKNDRKKLWLQLINAETEEEFNMLENTGVPEIGKAVVTLREMSKDEKIREIARLREKWDRDEKSALSYAKKEGRAEGRAEEREKMIAQLRKNGMTDEQIQRILNS